MTRRPCWESVQKNLISKNVHENRVQYPEERNAFVLDHHHGRLDVTCKPAQRGCLQIQWNLSFVTPLLKGHLYSGERDTFSWSRNPGLTSIQGTPYHSKSDCPQKSLISFCVRWSQWRQLSLTISLKIGALLFGEFNTQHRGDKLIINFLYIIKLLEVMTDRFRGRVRETY